MHLRLCRWRCALVLAALAVTVARGEIGPEGAALYLDFEKDEASVALVHGARRIQGRFGGALEFTTALQYAEADFSRVLDGAEAVTIGGWFFPRRNGEQYFFFHGMPEIGPQGERFFRPTDNWVNFVLGTDQHGFLLGTIHGNGSMPFVHVTVNEVAFDAWNQVVVIKDARGFQEFYLNGTLVHSDKPAEAAGKVRPFRDTIPGEPVRLAMPLGGLIGEVWVFRRELSAEEIKKDFLAKRNKYNPALPGEPVLLREMDLHPAVGLWKELVTAESWPKIRTRIQAGAMEILGEFPKEKVPLDPQILSETDCGSYLRRKVSIQVQPNDRMPAYLLIPKKLLASKPPARAPAILCFYGTTSGAGKDQLVGLSGRSPGTPPEKNSGFAVTFAEAGFVAFAADYLRDGERIKPGRRPSDTTDFYQDFPDWSIHGKDIWDNMRAIDYLQTLDFVDPDKIGMTGHSYGGHSTIFTAALEPRIKVAVANGPVSDFLHHGQHWAVPKGASNSQSMPALRPYVLDHTLSLPVTFYEFTALIAPRPFLCGQAVGERRPLEEENYAAVKQVYNALGCPERVRYHWYAGDHDYPPAAQQAAVEWFRRWFAVRPEP